MIQSGLRLDEVATATQAGDGDWIIESALLDALVDVMEEKLNLTKGELRTAILEKVKVKKGDNPILEGQGR